MEDAVTRDTIAAAATRIAPYIRRTPLLELDGEVFGLDCRLLLKLEHHQRSGSFKARGAFNLLLSREVPAAGVVAASGGNFGLAVADAARTLGHRATIFVPDSSSPAKVDAFRGTGADLRLIAGFYADALAASETFCASSGALFAHAYDQPEIVSGAGTLAREFEEQCGELPETFLVAVGGGGLIGGIAAWLQDRARIVGVETPGTAALHEALAAGEPVDVAVEGIAADALGARRIGEIGFALAQRWVDDSLLVPDHALIEARRLLWERARILCEPASAAPLAALLTGGSVPDRTERIGIVICGANTQVQF